MIEERRLASALWPLGCALVLLACGKGPADVDAATARQPARAAAPDSDDDQVTLSAEQIAKLGLVLSAAPAAEFSLRTAGFATVLTREAIAQALTEEQAARAAVAQSQAVSGRMQRLAGTPGADSAALREAAQRQLAADVAALQLAAAKISSLVGHPPAAVRDLVSVLADPTRRLLRVTFPLDAFRRAAPARISVARLGTDGGAARFTATVSWPAPADPTLPGHAYLAIVAQSDLEEGERLIAWGELAARRAPLAGVLVPATALVIRGVEYWCYVERQPGHFEHVVVDIGRQLPGGYFVDSQIEPGERVVTAGAGLLLARDANPGAAADD